MARQYVVGIGEFSSCRVTLKNTEVSSIVLPSGTKQSLVLHAGDYVRLAAQDPAGSDMYAVRLAGLVSDGQIIDLSGDFAFEVQTNVSQMDVFSNLEVTHGQALELSTANIVMYVMRYLGGNEILEVSATGSLSVSKALDGGDASIAIGTNSAKISAEVFTVLSDWIDRPTAEIADLTLDKLIYKEV